MTTISDMLKEGETAKIAMADFIADLEAITQSRYRLTEEEVERINEIESAIDKKVCRLDTLVQKAKSVQLVKEVEV